VGLLVLGHHHLELPGLVRLQIGEHGRGRPTLLERSLKLGSSHLVDGSVVLELAKHVMLHTGARAHRKG